MATMMTGARQDERKESMWKAASPEAPSLSVCLPAVCVFPLVCVHPPWPCPDCTPAALPAAARTTAGHHHRSSAARPGPGPHSGSGSSSSCRSSGRGRGSEPAVLPQLSMMTRQRRQKRRQKRRARGQMGVGRRRVGRAPQQQQQQQQPAVRQQEQQTPPTTRPVIPRRTSAPCATPWGMSP